MWKLDQGQEGYKDPACRKHRYKDYFADIGLDVEELTIERPTQRKEENRIREESVLQISHARKFPINLSRTHSMEEM